MMSHEGVDRVHGTFTEDIPWHSEFVDYVKTLGINAVFVVYYGSNYISLYVQSLVDALNAKDILSQDGMEAVMTDKFFELAKKSGYVFNGRGVRGRWQTEGLYLNYIYSFELDCMDATVRECKEAVTAQLAQNSLFPPPKYVFCHSGSEYSREFSYAPGYTVIFDGEVIAAEVEVNYRTEIIRIIRNVLLDHDRLGYWKNYEPNLIIDHSLSKSMYGYSRED